MDQISFAALGLDHRHIYGMTQGMLDAGAVLAGWWTEGSPQPVDGYRTRFPTAPRQELQTILNDPEISLVLIACRPDRRADLAIAAMRAGKDVMVDKPGCISANEVKRLRDTVRQTGRIWSVNFSERFEVPATTVATQLVRDGAIGKVIQTVGLGPHRLNAASRPDWFFNAATYGGILTDIASHQIEQFLHFTGSDDAEISMASVGNFANPDHPTFEDFGEVSLRSDNAQGYIRVDWYTADALPNWGDGRLFITGTEGSIELRKYVDVAGRPGTDHLFLVNGSRCEHIDLKTL
jgi:predicted dehydrogenase